MSICFESEIDLFKNGRIVTSIRKSIKGVATRKTSMTKKIDVQVPPPDGGYGWIIVIAAFCNFTLLGTHFMAFSLLYRTIVDNFEISYAVAGFVGSISVAFMQLPGREMPLYISSKLKILLTSCYAKGMWLTFPF